MVLIAAGDDVGGSNFTLRGYQAVKSTVISPVAMHNISRITDCTWSTSYNHSAHGAQLRKLLLTRANDMPVAGPGILPWSSGAEQHRKFPSSHGEIQNDTQQGGGLQCHALTGGG